MGCKSPTFVVGIEPHFLPEEEAQRVAELLTEEMQNAAQLSVPLTAEAHCGKNWLEAQG